MARDSANAGLPKRKLGRTGLDLSVLGFGCAPIGDIYAVLDDANAILAIEHAATHGVAYFDTAPHYGQGLAEHRLGTALRRHKKPGVVVSTKVGRLLTPAPKGRQKTTRYVGGHSFDVVHDYSYDATMRSFEASLHRLGRPDVDMLLIHDADAWTHGPVEGPKRYREAMDGAYRALEKLRSEKVIKAIGVGLNDPDYAARFLTDGDFDCMLLAGRYSLLEQPALDTVFPIAARKKVGLILGGVFNSGILATGAVPGAKYNYVDAPPDILDRVKRMELITESYDVPLATAAVQFCLACPGVASIVVGAVSSVEVACNIAAIHAPIPKDLWRELQREGLLDPRAPVPK
jgi:D-threo-aldose 1-dehydrogenase